MPDQDENRRPGESVQQWYDRLALRDAWHANQRLALAQKAKTDAQIKSAQENLTAALKRDADLGLDKSAALRNVKPIRPAVLDEKISALAPQADKDRLARLQADALREYRHHLLLADPALLDRSMLAELATAARIAATDPETIQE